MTRTTRHRTQTTNLTTHTTTIDGTTTGLEASTKTPPKMTLMELSNVADKLEELDSRLGQLVAATSDLRSAASSS